MAIINLTSYTGRLYQYDDVAQQFIMNPDNDAGLNALTGWNNTSYTITQLSDQHNGTTIFTGRPDYSGDAQKFPILVLAAGGVITNTTQVKVRVDRDPTMTYQGSLVFDETTIGTSTDITIDIDLGYVYATTTQYTANFTSGDYRDYTFNIPYTDPDTGRSNTLEVVLTYNEFPSAMPWEGEDIIAHNFRDATQGVSPYVDTTGGTYTMTPTIGPAYATAGIPVGNRVLTDYVLSSFLGNPGTAGRCRHIVYPAAQKPCMNRTRTTWTGSGGQNLFKWDTDYTFGFDTIAIGPQDGTEYTALTADIGSNTRDYFMRVYDGTNLLWDLNSFVNSFNPSVSDFVFRKQDGTNEFLTKPDTNSINGRRVIFSYKYNSGDGSCTITIYYKTIENTGETAPDYRTSVINIPNPYQSSGVQDIEFNGSTVAGGDRAYCDVRGITNFFYIQDKALDPTVSGDDWTYNFKELTQSMLALGDSYTGQFPLAGGADPMYDSFSNVILDEYDNAGGTDPITIHQHYTFDYYMNADNNYTCPLVTDPRPAWMGVNNIPSADSTLDLATIITKLNPRSCLLSYTGINYDIAVTGKNTNPAWGDVEWSEPIYACQEHTLYLDSLGIPWLTWNSMPTQGNTNLTGRFNDTNYKWDIFFPGKTLDTYSVSNDPGNPGFILPAYDHGDNVHLNVAGTDALGAYLYTNIVGVLIPSI